MGGSICLAIRFSDGTEWRNSVWTNSLPDWFFATDFFYKEKSEEHVRQWVGRHRKQEYSGKLIPDEYGIVAVDFMNGGGILSCNGYCSPHRIYLTPYTPASIRKFLSLQADDLIEEITIFREQVPDVDIPGYLEQCKEILKLHDSGKQDEGIIMPDFPFLCGIARLWQADQALYPEGKCQKSLEWIEKRFKLSGEERQGWEDYMTPYEEEEELLDLRLGAEFVVCIKNDGYLASLDVRKSYRFIPDSAEQALGLIRVIDESGEDYLYPKEFFASQNDAPEVE